MVLLSLPSFKLQYAFKHMRVKYQGDCRWRSFPGSGSNSLTCDPVSTFLPAVHLVNISGDTIIAVRHGNTQRYALCTPHNLIGSAADEFSELDPSSAYRSSRPFSIARSVACTQHGRVYIASVSSRTLKRISTFQLSPTDVIYYIVYANG